MEWIASGDVRRAASSLVVDYGSDVFATCLAIVRDRTAAEDLTQDIFGDAIRGLPTFRGDSAPRTWLLSIARHRCIDYLRAKKRDPSWSPWAGTTGDDDESDPDAQPDQAAFGSEWFSHRQQVARGLEALPEGDRALVVLRFKNGLEYDELAAAFGLRTGTVRMRVSRALARMREALEPNVVARGRGGAAAAPAPAPAAPAPRATGMGGMPPPGAPSMAAPAPIRGAPSWWQRLLAWARTPTRPPPAPVGDVGRALAMNDPPAPSEALLARLGVLVDGLPE